MDYFDVLKKAWEITWRNKALWVLGLFAAASFGGSSGGGSGSGWGSQDWSDPQAIPEAFRSIAMDPDVITRWLSAHLGLVIAAGAALLLISVVWWVLSVAARGGLVHGASRAAEGERPSLKTAWSVGFHHWGRVFMVGLALIGPLVVVGLAIAAGALALGLGMAGRGDAAAGPAAGMFCCGLPLVVVIAAVIAIALSILYELALRYGVLMDVSFGRAIRRAWDDLMGRKGAIAFWAVMILPGIAFGLIVAALFTPIALLAVLLAYSEQYVLLGAVLAVLIIVSLAITSVYSTFSSSAWTVFFRRMTGMEAPAVKPSPYAYQPGQPPIAPVVAPPPRSPGTDA